MSTIVLTPTVTHIAKSPYHPIDIYSQHIAKEYPSTWHEGLDVDVDTVKDVKLLHYDTVISQDHSKWAVSETDLYWVGDLDRTTPHFRRGGGGFLIRHAGISLALRTAPPKRGPEEALQD
jgi:hypothetical protein